MTDAQGRRKSPKNRSPTYNTHNDADTIKNSLEIKNGSVSQETNVWQRLSQNRADSDEELEEHQEKAMLLQEDIAWDHRNLTKAQDRLSHEMQHNKVQESIEHRLTPITNALKCVREVAKDLRGLVDAFIRYAESNEAMYEGVQNQSRTRNIKCRRNQTPREHSSSHSRSQEQIPWGDTRHRGYEKAMQEPFPKHSRPGRPANHTWDQFYFAQYYRRQIKENILRANEYEDDFTGSHNHKRSNTWTHS